MFLKSLIISSGSNIIRNIPFHKGINFIVDETPNTNDQTTGNNVGKTTVLKLIDFCLGGSPDVIYMDQEAKQEYALVKNYLINNKVLVSLCLKENLDIESSREIIIERNFLTHKNRIKKINGESFTDAEFLTKLSELIIPEHKADKPTFRQIISHNIRYNDNNINNILKTLNKYTSDAEYETLYLFLLGCIFNKGNIKQELLLKLKQEETYKNRLEMHQTKTAYEAALAIIENDIDELNKKKTIFNVNDNFENDLDKLTNLKYEINRKSSEITNMNIRKDIIIQAHNELESNISNIDLKQLQLIYQQAVDNISTIQKTFADLVQYHNQMIIEKVRYITKDLPTLELKIANNKQYLKMLLDQEKQLSVRLSKSDTFEELQSIIITMNDRYRKKGEYESIISQINDVEKNITNYNDRLNKIDDELFSSEFKQNLKNQIKELNKYFSSISNTLYGESYGLKYDIKHNKQNQPLYKFSSFNANLSSGKKQGEILCFDIAYTLFADNEKISCLHFLLNDKKELMHDNQLVKISEYVNNINLQLVISILKDKLPEKLNDEKYFVIKLSQTDKLFRIESY